MSAEPILSFHKLSFGYSKLRELIQDASLNLDGASLTLLSGENGSGKSTLLKLLCGDLQPSSGEVLWMGKPLPKDRNQFFNQIWHHDQESSKQQVGVCPRHDLEIWQMALGVHPRSPDWSEEAIRFKLAPQLLDLPYHQLSSGEAQAVSLMPLSRIISRFWLLDEPLSGLDQERAQSVIQLCGEKLKLGVGMLIVTHDPVVYRSLPHRHIELRDRKLRDLG